MIDEGYIRSAQTILDREIANALSEALKPEPMNGSRGFHAGVCSGLKQVLDELLGPNRDQWEQWRLSEPVEQKVLAVEQNLQRVLKTLKSGMEKSADAVLKPEVMSSTWRDFQAGLYQGLQKSIDLLDPRKIYR